MKVKTRKVYYCDFCKTKKLTSSSMRKHEKHCTANPNRECRLCGNTQSVVAVSLEKTEKARIEWLREKAENCPMCIFAALRQSQAYVDGSLFDYEAEVHVYRTAKREAAAELFDVDASNKRVEQARKEFYAAFKGDSQ